MIEERFEAEKFLLEEWKANNELFKWHEDLKQKRFSFFLSFQTAFLAAIALLVREIFSQKGPLCATTSLNYIAVLVVVLVISAMALIVVRTYASMDKRARSFVDTVKSKILIIENNWNERYPDTAFSTYRGQFAILVHRRTAEVQRYQDVRGIAGDRFAEKINAPAAHMTEELLFRCFTGCWVLLSALSIIGLLAIFSGKCA